MSEQRTLTAAVHQEEDWFIAQCLEVDIASQGQSIQEALANLREAVELYFAEVPEAEVTTTPLVTSFQIPGTAA
ncbi:type II toxin-antitoxin system HicB family antitoxin [Actinokineospora sp. G85]|uniref:type II toxin-antitoxin system HicB family antitoxin n=1 Tax=Actinokineospora sp. G85 TaxID=3406626 RepID=UPI003C735797